MSMSMSMSMSSATLAACARACCARHRRHHSSATVSSAFVRSPRGARHRARRVAITAPSHCPDYFLCGCGCGGAAAVVAAAAAALWRRGCRGAPRQLPWRSMRSMIRWPKRPPRPSSASTLVSALIEAHQSVDALIALLEPSAARFERQHRARYMPVTAREADEPPAPSTAPSTMLSTAPLPPRGQALGVRALARLVRVC